MFLRHRKLFCGFLILSGLTIVLGNGWIFKYLVHILGPEKMVGKEYVIYTPEGCFYTNPGKIMLWCVAIASLGIAIFSTGLFMFFRKHKTMLPGEDFSTPLAWPDSWKNLSPKQKFFMGTPFVGLDWRTFKAFKQKLRHRGENIHNLWTGDLELCSIRDDVATMLAKIFGWPNTFFHPEDPCSILFGHPRGDLEIVEMFQWLEDHYCVSLDHILNRLVEMSFYQLIEQIRDAIHDDET